MNHFSPRRIGAALVFFLGFTYNFSIAQCGTETYTITNQCLGQQPQVQINGVQPSNVNYFWYDDAPALVLGSGTNIVYPTALAGTETFNYIKQITHNGGPSALPGPYTNPGAVPSSGDAYDMTVTSAVPYLLNYVTVAIHAYSCNASTEYRLKVQVNTSYSQWHYFTCADMIATNNTNIKLVRVPVYATVGQLGLPVAAGASTITILTAADGTQKAGSTPVDAFEWYSSASFASTYNIGTAPSNLTINYGAAVGTISGQANKVPGLFDWNVTLLCAPVPVTVNTASASGCCVPGNVSTPAITSSTGSNIVDVVPISPAITLSTPLQTGYYYQWFKDGVPMGPSFQGTNVNSISVTDVGKYTVKVAENSSFINTFSCTKDNLMWVQKRILFAEANKTTVCLGESVELLAKGATGPVSWSPASNLSSATSATPIFSPPSPGSYTLTTTGEVPVGYQIINGDFEAGNVGVNPSTYYTYVNPAGSTNTTPSYAIGFPNRRALSIGVGNYTINEYVFWPGFQAWLPCADHTTGSGKFLYTDASGANQPGTVKFLWSQDVVVQPGINYEFAAWVMNFNAEGDPGYVVPPGVSGITVNPASNPPPDLMLYVNDVPVWTPTALDPTAGLWQKISTIWNSGTNNGTVKLKLAEVFPGPATGGHDFGLDDISFGAPGFQNDDITITVNDCNFITATISACNGDSVTITANTNGVFTGWTNTTLTNPSTSTIGIKNPSQIITKAKAEAGVSSSFTATAKFIFGNEIENGDFSAFKSGFSSTYSEVTNPGGTGMNPGQFVVGATPVAVDNTFFVNKNDHTTNTATPAYFVGDSRWEATRSVAYRTSVDVVNGDEYGFSGWFANIHKEFIKASPDTLNTASYPNGAKTTHLALYVNNQFVRRIDLPLDTAWHNITATWTANTTGPVNLELRSLNIPFASLKSGFVMDDLKFGKIYSLTKSATVTAVCALPVTYLKFTAERLAARTSPNRHGRT